MNRGLVFEEAEGLGLAEEKDLVLAEEEDPVVAEAGEEDFAVVTELMQKKSKLFLQKNIILREKNKAAGSALEAPGRQPEGTRRPRRLPEGSQETPGRLLGGIQEADGGTWRHPEACGRHLEASRRHSKLRQDAPRKVK